MSDLISPRVLTGAFIAHKAKEFQHAKPFPYVVIDAFISQKQTSVLLKALQKEPFEQKRADLFQFSQTNDLHGASQYAIQEMVRFLDSAAFADYLQEITGIRVRAGASDVFGSLYTSTDYLLCHDDQLEKRKLAFILYLSSLPEKQGGALALRADVRGVPGKVVTRVHPLAGRLVVFAVSEKSWHEVEEVLSEVIRYAIGGWLH